MNRFVATLILALLAGAAWPALTADVLRAQDAAEPLRQPEVQQLSDEEIRDLLAKESVADFRYYYENSVPRSYLEGVDCSELNSYDGPAVYCDPSEVPDEAVQEYRAQQQLDNSTFLTEGMPKF